MQNNFFNGRWYSIDNPPPVHAYNYEDMYGDINTDYVSEKVILYDNIMEDYVFTQYIENDGWCLGGSRFSANKLKENGFTYWTFLPEPPKSEATK